MLWIPKNELPSHRGLTTPSFSLTELDKQLKCSSKSHSEGSRVRIQAIKQTSGYEKILHFSSHMFWNHSARKLLNHTNFSNKRIAWMAHEIAEGYG